jgi:acetyltransferase, GNAT family
MRDNFQNKFEDIVLKSLEQKNIEDLRILRNKKENRKCFIYQNEITREEQEKWYKNYLKKENDIMFSAFINGVLEKPIGYAALYDIDKSSKKCEFGRIIVDKSRISKKGIGYQITKCLCEIGFEKLGLEMIYLEVFSDNIPAIKTYLKAGFVEKNRYEKEGKEIIYMELYK